MTRTTRIALAALSFFALAVGGCASESGYNVDVRNNTSSPVRLDVKAAANGEEPKVVDSFHVAAGGTQVHFTKLPAKDKVTLEANIEGDSTHPAAAMPITLGQTLVDVIPNSQARDNAPRVRLREREGH